MSGTDAVPFLLAAYGVALLLLVLEVGSLLRRGRAGRRARRQEPHDDA
jgi:hypothetical protein